MNRGEHYNKIGISHALAIIHRQTTCNSSAYT